MIEYCVQHINPLDAIEPMPGNNAPVERQEYAQLEQDLQGTIAVRDAKITAAQSDVEERNLEADRARIVQEDTQYLESMHYPEEIWNGGRVHRIRPNILHLMRGQVFTMGGGYSIDAAMRIPGRSWWPEEMPSDDEYAEAWTNLAAHGNKIDR